ncbi:MAG TPA: GlsB/YeaQ/YmgE family stress response membrane protein [Candidatus Binataceae bacterium]|jgi:uncharacterized membrane protein YeaQ/YmgE (transglycosylase-associated protein family)|nr:GlsB/YeaQ/YmgE family stress response membrane protein [Candidatus Binataceae bacterium]
MVGAIVIGLIAGWLAGKIVRGQGYGMLADILLGLVGAVIGSRIFDVFDIRVYSGVGHLAMATVGAVVLVGIVHLIHNPSALH